MSTNFDPSSDDGINDINITPFVDVVLVLLVIFMVTAPIMVRESLNVKLPQSESSDSSNSSQFGISLNKNGQVIVNGKIVSFESLLVEAKLAISENKNVKALISADKNSSHGDVIKVIDTVKKAGISNFAFQIERISKK